jgi:small nuclear ribonucleoprotein (snRNP)-like protein
VEEMNEGDIKFLKSKVDKGEVEILFTDGEKIKAHIVSVSEIESDVIFEMLSTDRPAKYEHYNSNFMRSPLTDVASVS